jgi:hypothetical protein
MELAVFAGQMLQQEFSKEMENLSDFEGLF